ncbi:MAG TPA: hypothetical protein VFH88_06595, partial [Candidatus Krumholzibacteria bacterium]|nr:hypothetical protein [Candidatus Krumholzibacteria bacterium]
MDLEQENELGMGSEPSKVWSWEGWDERNLPLEPESVAPEGDASQRLQDLRAFYLYGRRPADAPSPGGGVLPALLHPYRDLARVRTDYPLCVNGSNPALRTLTEWTDQFIADHAGEGDAGEQLKRNVYRLESVVRALASEREGERLSVLWDRAAATVLETSNVPPEKEALLRDHVAAVRGALSNDAEVVVCGPQAALRLLQVSARAFWKERCGGWTDELDGLVRALRDILSADFNQSDEARSADHLRESLASADDDVDAGAMSHLLANAPRESALPASRRARIEALVDVLERMQPVFDAGRQPGDGAIRFDRVFEDLEAAVAEVHTRAASMTEFFRTVRIARLEIQNRYRPDIHDPYFAGFDERYLTDDERALCPPVLVHLGDETLSRAEIGTLLGILNASVPVKVMVELRTLYAIDGDAATPGVRLTGAARLASMTAAMNQAYVLQAPLSHVSVLRAALLDGLRFDGPALFSIYAPGASSDPAGAPFLRAAAAAESRVFPVLVFNPAGGATLAERIDIQGNPQPESCWPASAFSFRRADGDDAVMDVAFTPADYLFCDRRLAGHFWMIESDRWHDNLTPVHEFLEMTPEQAAGRIPYLATVGREGHLGRAVVARPLIDVARQCRTYWRGV